MSCAPNRRKRFWNSIATRLTLWGAAAVFCICALICVMLYLGVAYALRHEVDSFLEGEVREFMLTVNGNPNDDAQLEQAIRSELGSRQRHDLAFRLFDQEGRLIVTSEPDDALAPLWRPPPGWSEQSPHFFFRTLRPPQAPFPCRTCSLRVTTADGRPATAQASYRLDAMMASLALFRRVCALALALAIVLALVAGRLLAARLLRPVRTLTAAAKRINAARLVERVPLAGSGDELDQLSATINQMLDRIERHVRQVQQFTADASHEFRTPITALRGSAEVALSRDAPRDELRAVLADSIEQYDRLLRIAEDLLLLARADAGEPLIRCEPTNLAGAARDVIDLYQPLAQDRDVELVLVARASPTVLGDGARLRQLVGNLVDNALKHTPPGGKITVAVSRNAGSAELRVRDTGPGIPSEHLPHVFDRFYRADRARSTQHGSAAGLGLAICRTIARAHGGSLSARNEHPGAVFIVRLPCSVPPAERHELLKAQP